MWTNSLNRCLDALLLFLLVCLVFGSIEVHDEDHLSKYAHYEGEQHNTQYDHDAFLGPKQAKEFEEISDEDAKKRLRVMIPRVDLDGDRQVSVEELEKWIDKQRKVFMYDAAEEDIASYDTDGDKLISLKEYKKARFGESDDDQFPRDKVLQHQIQQTRRKFDAADLSKDGKLDSDEYVLFQHPEEAPHMEQIAIEEVIEEVDKDGDGYISIDEFLGQYGDDQGPAWVAQEREYFAKTFDLNGNDKLEMNEIRMWVIPARGESREEAEHLMEGTDENADGLLSVDEIILHFDLFVGSRATDHGETLKRMRHDEF